jgi:hypothetical protein
MGDGRPPADASRIDPDVFAEIARDAERTIELTVENARALPGLLGRIAPACLRVRGWYGCTLDGVRTLYIRKGIAR